MEWQMILAIVLVATVVVLPAMFVWYLNIGGIHAAIRERGGIRISAIARKAVRWNITGIRKKF